MTDEQFIEILRKIKERCLKISCGECPFRTDNCQLQAITSRLNAIPIDWEIEEIKSGAYITPDDCINEILGEK